MRDYFWLDGVRCDDYGITLQSPVQFGALRPRLQSFSVPGRNGSLHISEGAFENVTGKASCFVLDRDISRALQNISNWAFQGGYRRLETSEEPEVYRMAVVTAGMDVDIRVRLLAPFELSFDCMPQRFLKHGEHELAVENGDKLYNSWQPSKPLLKVHGSGAGALRVGDVSLQLLDGFNGWLSIDCESFEAYNEDGSQNEVISAVDFPTLQSGETVIQWSGGIDEVRLIPRWWSL